MPAQPCNSVNRPAGTPRQCMSKERAARRAPVPPLYLFTGLCGAARCQGAAWAPRFACLPLCACSTAPCFPCAGHLKARFRVHLTLLTYMRGRLPAYRAPKRSASKERPEAGGKRCRVLRLETPQPAGGAGQRRGQQGWASAGRAAKGTDKVSLIATNSGFLLLSC